LCPVWFLLPEDLVDVDGELAGDCDDGSLPAASCCDSFVEGFELWVEARCMLRSLDEDPANVPVPLPSDASVEGVVGGLSLAWGEACVGYELVGGWEAVYVGLSGGSGLAS